MDSVLEEQSDDIFNEDFEDTKCDFCCVGDCSLCNVGWDERAANGEIIC